MRSLGNFVYLIVVLRLNKMLRLLNAQELGELPSWWWTEILLSVLSPYQNWRKHF